VGYLAAVKSSGVFAGCRFTSNWTTRSGFLWFHFLKEVASGIRDYLEIGSFEGRSALLAGWLFPNARITCVDPFESEWPPGRATSVEATFDANTAGLGSRLTKLVGRSSAVLARLAEAHTTFDLIFIDGSHAHDDVMLDTLAAWRCLRKGGYLIWDDYYFHDPGLGRATVRQAVDRFLDAHAEAIEPVFAAWQVCVRRIA
jgi:predicted O-methyltransferase YrrM